MHSDVVNLIKGKGGQFWPTRHERRLLKFALDTFGDYLTQFLLMGLGDKNIGQRRSFTIAYVGAGGATLKRQVQVITYEPLDGQSFLPQGRDPLILLALLFLLNQHQVIKSTLFYNLEEVLSLLGWRNSDESRQEIDDATRRYFLLNYMWKMNRAELASHGLSFYTANESMVSAHETTGEDVGADKQIERATDRLTFNEFFIRGLSERALFKVDWNRVQSIKIVSSPVRRK